MIVIKKVNRFGTLVSQQAPWGASGRAGNVARHPSPRTEPGRFGHLSGSRTSACRGAPATRVLPPHDHLGGTEFRTTVCRPEPVPAAAFCDGARRGHEVNAGLKSFAQEQNLSDASFKAIGALQSVKPAWYNLETKKHDASAGLNEQVELLSLIGDVAQQDGKPIVHAHMVVGRSDGTTAGAIC